MCKDFSWSELHRARREAERRFGDIFALPLRKRVRDVVVACTSDDAAVLEIGAGDRRYAETIARCRRGVRYESMDVDPRIAHDHRDLGSIDKRYDCVFALEVIEHLPLVEIRPWLARIHELLVDGGRLVLSTPNTFYPPAYLRDATHRTPLCYDELAALAAMAGLYVTAIYRIQHEPPLRAFVRRRMFGWLFRLIRIDFARQIVLVAERRATT